MSLPEKMIVLAVDDDSSNLKALTRIFYDCEDYALHCVGSGVKCLETLEHLTPDLILLDIQMPQMNGYEVCRCIKENSETRGIMVLLLSGQASLADRLQGYEVEADDYLTKPYDEQELLAKVKILLRLKQAQDRLSAMNSELSTLVDVKTREIVRKDRQALVGQMALGIVHNLRGPLTGAKGMAELAEFNLSGIVEKLDDNNEYYADLLMVKDNLKKSLAANNALAEMISGILSKGRFDAQKALQEIDLNRLIAEEIEFLNADSSFKYNVEKRTNFDKSLPPIHAVPADFSQLCFNLMKNAVDAMQDEDERVLSVATTYDDEDIYIRFQDTGKGLDPGHEKEIFDPFFTTKPSAEEAKEGESVGTGLGLYTCLELVKLYNGAIEAESLESGGSVFTVRIPLNQAS